jgi:hypothetical protein
MKMLDGAADMNFDLAFDDNGEVVTNKKKSLWAPEEEQLAPDATSGSGGSQMGGGGSVTDGGYESNQSESGSEVEFGTGVAEAAGISTEQ